jgi:hypothetical protein
MKTVPDIADVVELQTWASNRPYSVSTLKEDLEAALAEEEQDEAETYAREVFEEIAERAQLLGPAYPFTQDGITLAPNQLTIGSSYLFCLGLTFFDNVTLELRTREFEGIVQTAAMNYFGGSAVRIGAPWATGEITDYRTLLEKVSDLIPDLGPPTQLVAPSGGDAGWDVVVVNNFADSRFSRIIALGNCATGKTDWRRKGLETQPTLFWSFFTRPPQATNVCLTFVAVPFLMSEQEKLRKAGQTCITFDRIRICEHAPSANQTVMEWLAGNRADALNIALL